MDLFGDALRDFVDIWYVLLESSRIMTFFPFNSFKMPNDGHARNENTFLHCMSEIETTSE